MAIGNYTIAQGRSSRYGTYQKEGQGTQDKKGKDSLIRSN